MRFDVVSLMPELFTPFLHTGITRRAYASGQLDVRLWNPREFAQGRYRRVDDRPFGGGPGMVMMAEPLHQCLQAIYAQRAQEAQIDDEKSLQNNELKNQNAPLQRPAVILFSPTGEVLRHELVQHWAQSAGAVLLCGRYEGIDQRLIEHHVTHQISLGDFVLSGGELPALVLLDAIARLQPGVLNEAASHQCDSFNPAIDGLLDCPHYTRPEVWEGQAVPSVLLGGHHGHIQQWRREQSLRLSGQQRPELIAAARAQGKLTSEDEAYLRSIHSPAAVPALPVLKKDKVGKET